MAPEIGRDPVRSKIFFLLSTGLTRAFDRAKKIPIPFDMFVSEHFGTLSLDTSLHFTSHFRDRFHSVLTVFYCQLSGPKLKPWRGKNVGKIRGPRHAVDAAVHHPIWRGLPAWVELR
jgi:hypothetical protein